MDSFLPTQVSLLIENGLVWFGPGSQSGLSPGFVAIAGERIAAVGPMRERPAIQADNVLDATGHLVMPGLVNGHCHAAMTLFRGLADDLPLMTWLQEHIFPAEARFVTPAMVTCCTRLAAAEMIRAGITTVADAYFHENEAASALAEAGLRTVAAQGVIDFPAPGVPDPARNVAVASEFIAAWRDRSPLVRPALFCHSPYTCSPATLTASKEATRRLGALMFIHLAETRAECQHVASLHGTTPVRHLSRLGLLDADTVCVHCIHVDEEEIDLLAASGCSVITCPQSNLKLASGFAPVDRLLARGIRVGLGTDGCASNNRLDLFREMDAVARIHKGRTEDPTCIPAATALAMGTTLGAAALGLGDQLGRLAPGGLADLVLMDLASPRLLPFSGPDALVYAAGAGDVATVIVGGRVLMRDRRLLSIDLEATRQEVSELHAALRRSRSA